MRKAVLAGLSVAVMVVFWVMNCSGPRPEVTEVQVVAPGSVAEPCRVQAQIQNRGQGHGQVSVVVRLRDPAIGRAFQDEQEVMLEDGETAVVTATIFAPPGDYTPEVEAEYPPR